MTVAELARALGEEFFERRGRELRAQGKGLYIRAAETADKSSGEAILLGTQATDLLQTAAEVEGAGVVFQANMVERVVTGLKPAGLEADPPVAVLPKILARLSEKDLEAALAIKRGVTVQAIGQAPRVINMGKGKEAAPIKRGGRRQAVRQVSEGVERGDDERNKQGLEGNQYFYARALLRLTDRPEMGVSLDSSVEDLFPREIREIMESGKDRKTAIVRMRQRIYNAKNLKENVTAAVEKALRKISDSSSEIVFPVPEQWLGDEELPDDIRDLCARINREKDYSGQTLTEIMASPKSSHRGPIARRQGGGKREESPAANGGWKQGEVNNGGVVLDDCEAFAAAEAILGAKLPLSEDQKEFLTTVRNGLCVSVKEAEVAEAKRRLAERIIAYQAADPAQRENYWSNTDRETGEIMAVLGGRRPVKEAMKILGIDGVGE